MKRRIWTAALSAIGMCMLILDTKTALAGAADGIELCLRVVIPSLLPFFVLSMLLTSSLNGTPIPFLGSLGRLCGIPEGAESLLIVGLLGGYPVGAQTVAAAHRDGQLSKATAQRMIGFCSNAGPSFLFGIVAGQFSHWWIPWVLWGIHIVSALLVGILLPGKETKTVRLQITQPISLMGALRRSLSVMGMVCGWILLFRIMIQFLSRWFLWLLPQTVQTILMGILELTNGCCSLDLIENVGLRFVAAAGLLAFGGLCVTMQTASAVQPLGLRSYLLGKSIQTVLSVLLAFLAQMLLFPAGQRIQIHGALAAMLPVILAFFAVLLRESEKKSSIAGRLGV